MIAELLHKVAGMEREDAEAYRPRPSSAGPERCIRQMVYHRLGTPADTEMSDRFIHVLNDSSWHEELTGDWLGKTAFVLHSRQMGVSLLGALDWMPDEVYECPGCHTMVNRHDLHGHLDGIVTDMLGTDRLYEHKALNHFTFASYWERTEEPEDYYVQCAIYLRALHAINPALTEAVLLIKNKNTSGFLEFAMRYDYETDTLTVFRLTRHTGESIELAQLRPNIVGAAIEKFGEIERHGQRGTLPERPYESDHWRCQYCRFQQTCWSSFLGEIEALATDAQLDSEEADRVRYYQELGAQIKEQEDERRAIGAEILAALKARGAKKARAGEYGVRLVAQERRSIDWDGVPLSIQHGLDPFRRKTYSEFIRVTKAKGA